MGTTLSLGLELGILTRPRGTGAQRDQSIWILSRRRRKVCINDPNGHIIIDDGRRYLNRTRKKIRRHRR